MNIALVIAGGAGARTEQEIPKQFITVYDKPIIIYTLENLENNEYVDDIIVAVPEGWEYYLTVYAKQFNITKLKAVISGGSTRHETIEKGIEYSYSNYDKDDILVVLDANRPLTPKKVFAQTISVVKQNNNVCVATEPCYDSMFLSYSGKAIDASSDRKVLYKGQTPESGRINLLKEIYDFAKEQNVNDLTTTELSLRFGKSVDMISGSVKSFKITTKDDIELFKALLKVDCNNLI